MKYAATGSRWAGLLACEATALSILRDVGMPAASARWLEEGDLCYLEIQRFDRAGATGRLPFLSAGAVDDELFGHRDNWSAFAARCAAARLMDAADAERIGLLAAFGVLIGNTDMHFENLGLVPDYGNGTYRLAPAYDMLPMRYAPTAGGLLPTLEPLKLRLANLNIRLDQWAQAKPWAVEFWRRVAGDARVGDAFQALAIQNADTVETTLARLE